MTLAMGIRILMLTAACSSAPGCSEEPPSQLTRAEAITTAERYLRHIWMPSANNVFHGIDPDGIRVDTPDADFLAEDASRGWWRVGEKNEGIPYMWGGFDTPESFDAGLLEGKSAGDAYSAEKRRLLDDAVSKHAVGIDCSGFVSRCWQLPRSFSTRELTALCEAVTDFAELRPGDVFNLHNAHVVLFAGWEETETSDGSGDPLGRTRVATEVNERSLLVPGPTARLRAYEAGSDGMEKVVLSSIPLSLLVDKGYTAWRYRGIRD